MGLLINQNIVTLNENSPERFWRILEGQGKVRPASGRLRIETPEYRQPSFTQCPQTIASSSPWSHSIDPKQCCPCPRKNRQPLLKISRSCGWKSRSTSISQLSRTTKCTWLPTQVFYKKAACFVLRSLAKHSQVLPRAIINSGALESLSICVE